MNIINEFFVSFILIKLYFKFKVCRKIKFPLLWKFYFSKWKFYFSADKNVGPYGNNKAIYQEYVEFNSCENEYYQAGVFFAYEGCGLGFRKGGLVLDNYSKFVGHIIKD